jgi:aldose sugar dehydrogenase
MRLEQLYHRGRIIKSISVFLLLFAAPWCLPSSAQITEQNLAIQTVTSGLDFPTGMAFIAPNDMLVTEKNTGKVQRIINGQMLAEPVIDVSVANDVERGLLGIAVSKNVLDNKTYVFLYYTESDEGTENGNGNEASDIEVSDGTEEEEQKEGEGEGEDGGEPIGNRLYRYEFVNDKLVNPKLLLNLPYLPGPAHNGGVIAIGPDNNVYVMVGNLYSPVLNKDPPEPNLAQNQRDGENADGRGGIVRVTQQGQIVDQTNGILGDEHPLNMYYAYGIRNSFGIAFDPLTGNLWDTENGGQNEINLVEPGFNSGYDQVTGMPNLDNDQEFDVDDLVDFNGRGKYSDPELDIVSHIAPTAIVFFDSKKYGEQFYGDMFVGSVSGEIFQLNLDKSRTELELKGKLSDKVGDPAEELDSITFAKNMGLITDLEVGFDGYLYATIYDKGEIIRIIPTSTTDLRTYNNKDEIFSNDDLNGNVNAAKN